METILNKHPDLESTLRGDSNLKRYTLLTQSGTLKEMWEKNEQGYWVDVTAREKLKIAISQAQEELNKCDEEDNTWNN